MHQAYKDQAEFLFVYIREAHPSNGSWADDGVKLVDPADLDKRGDAAGSCASELNLTMPSVVDDMDDTVNLLYSAWPERIVVIDTAGKIRYRGKLGPFGFKPREAKKALGELLEEEF